MTQLAVLLCRMRCESECLSILRKCVSVWNCPAFVRLLTRKTWWFLKLSVNVAPLNYPASVCEPLEALSVISTPIVSSQRCVQVVLLTLKLLISRQAGRQPTPWWCGLHRGSNVAHRCCTTRPGWWEVGVPSARDACSRLSQLVVIISRALCRQPGVCRLAPGTLRNLASSIWHPPSYLFVPFCRAHARGWYSHAAVNGKQDPELFYCS